LAAKLLLEPVEVAGGHRKRPANDLRVLRIIAAETATEDEVGSKRRTAVHPGCSPARETFSWKTHGVAKCGPKQASQNVLVTVHGSNLEIESLFRQSVVHSLVESVQPCGPMRDVLFDFIGFFHDLHPQHFLAEVSLVELSIQDHFVQVLMLS
jgi:hypothetical protein